MAKDKKEEKDGEESKEPKKSKLRLIIIIVGVLLLGAGGYFGWDMYKNKGDEANQEGEEKEIVTIVYPLKSFVVNLADKKGLGKRYLKVTMEVEVESEESLQKVESNTPKVRDTVLLLLSSKQINEINTMEGKLDLKQALLSRMNRILGEGIIKRIYFSEFVVQ